MNRPNRPSPVPASLGHRRNRPSQSHTLRGGTAGTDASRKESREYDPELLRGAA